MSKNAYNHLLKKYYLRTVILTILVVNGLCWSSNKADPTMLVFPPYLHTYGIRKATKYHLFLFMQNKVRFSDPQGLAVVRLLSWDDPEKEGDDDEVTVYGVNSGQNNIIYNTSMTTLGIYGLNERGIRKLNKPRGITANSAGDVYVADTGNNRIVRLFNSGNRLQFVKSIGNFSDVISEFKKPHGVTLDSQGNVYITDTGNNRIKIYDKDDQFKDSFGEFGKENGKMFYPDAIVVADPRLQWSFYKDEFILIIDLNNSRIQKFSLDGKFVKCTNMNEHGYVSSFLAYMALDYYNNVYVTDRYNHCIHKFDRNLNYLGSYGEKGTGDKEFIEPRGITIYRRFGQVFIAEKKGAQYYWVGTDFSDFTVQTQYQNENAIMFKYFLIEPSFVTADVYTQNDEFVTRIWNSRFRASGQQNDMWNLSTIQWPDSILLKEHLTVSSKFKNVKRVPKGKYKINYKIEPTYSSYQYFHKQISEHFEIQ